MPSTEVKLGHSNEALHRILNIGDGQQCLWMSHETASLVSQSAGFLPNHELLSLCYAFQHGPGLKNKGGEGDSAQVRTRP